MFNIHKRSLILLNRYGYNHVIAPLSSWKKKYVKFKYFKFHSSYSIYLIFIENGNRIGMLSNNKSKCAKHKSPPLSSRISFTKEIRENKYIIASEQKRIKQIGINCLILHRMTWRILWIFAWWNIFKYKI